MLVFLIAAQTLDGKIAKQSEERSFDWTSQEDKRWHVRKTREAGVLIMGRKTYQTFNTPLPGRLNLIYSRRAEQFLSMSDQDVIAQKGKTLLLYTSGSPLQLVDKLERCHYTQLSVSGGVSVYRQFLEAGVVGKIYLTIEPYIFGEGISMFDQLTVEPQLSLVDTHQLNSNTLVLEYQVSI